MVVLVVSVPDSSHMKQKYICCLVFENVTCYSI